MQQMRTSTWPTKDGGSETFEMVDGVARDIIEGKEAMQNDMNMGGFKLNNLGNAENDADSLPYGQAKEEFAPSGYGLGENTGQKITDLNAATKSGFYYFDATAENNPLSAAGYMQVIAQDEWSLKQEAEFFTSSVPVSYDRFKHAAQWQEWKRSSSEDVIVAQGTSGIWTYRKWASGLAECWGVFDFANLESYYTDNVLYYYTINLDYPFDFVSTPTAVYTCSVGGMFGMPAGNPRGQYAMAFTVASKTGGTNTVRCSGYAIGRWK